jgi:hypothetical protein
MDPVSFILSMAGGLAGKLIGEAVFEPKRVTPALPPAAVERKWQDDSEAKVKAMKLLDELKADVSD